MAFGVSDAINIVGAAGSAFGIGERRQDERQIRQQRALNNEGLKTSKEMLDYQKMKDKQFLDETNWSYQLEQARKAGLSPGFLMGKGGGTSGTIGSSGGSMGVGQAADAASTQNAGINQAMLVAQMENIKANTEKTKVEAENIGGVEKEKTIAETQGLLAGITNNEAKTKLTEVQTRMQEMQNEVYNETMEESIDTIRYGLKKQAQELGILETQGKLDKAQYEDKINLLHGQAVGIYIANAYNKAQTDKTKSDIRVNEQEIKKMAAEIKQKWASVSQGWVGLSQGERQTRVQEFEKQMKANYPSISETMGRYLDDGITKILKPFGGREYSRKLR